MGVGVSDEQGTPVDWAGAAVGVRGELRDHRARHPLLARDPHPEELEFTDSVYKVLFKKSIPIQIRQLILHLRNSKG